MIKLLGCKKIISKEFDILFSLLCCVSLDVYSGKGYFVLKQINSEKSEMPVQNKLVSLNDCADLSTDRKHIISFLPASVKYLKRKTRARIVTIIIPFVNIVFNRFSKWIGSLLRLLNTYTDCLCS